jgi:hypothetical protein
MGHMGTSDNLSLVHYVGMNNMYAYTRIRLRHCGLSLNNSGAAPEPQHLFRLRLQKILISVTHKLEPQHPALLRLTTKIFLHCQGSGSASL